MDLVEEVMDIVGEVMNITRDVMDMVELYDSREIGPR